MHSLLEKRIDIEDFKVHNLMLGRIRDSSDEPLRIISVDNRLAKQISGNEFQLIEDYLDYVKGSHWPFPGMNHVLLEYLTQLQQGASHEDAVAIALGDKAVNEELGGIDLAGFAIKENGDGKDAGDRAAEMFAGDFSQGKEFVPGITHIQREVNLYGFLTGSIVAEYH